MPISPKGSRKNNFPEFALRFGADWVDLREHNRKRRQNYAEDCVSEDRPKMARRWDAKMGSNYFASLKVGISLIALLGVAYFGTVE